MTVRNWMQADPMTIPSDMLVSEAKRLLSENNLHALPVVDGGRLRGLVTRANLLRTGHFVLRTQSSAEFDYFATRLKVKDIMVRNPATVRAEAAGAVRQALYTVGRHDGEAEEDYPEKKIIIRFHAQDARGVVAALTEAGFSVTESVEIFHPALAA